jgi:DNA-binding XRE family transcriptional regulator
MKRVAIVFAGLTRSSLLSHEREPLRVCPSMNLAAGVSTKKLYKNAHLTLERAPSLSVADMNATMTAWRGLRVAERAAAVGVSADTIRYYERTGLLLAPARTPSGYRAYEASRKTRPDNCPVKVPQVLSVEATPCSQGGSTCISVPRQRQVSGFSRR